MTNRLVELIASQAAKYGDREVFRHKEHDKNDWIPTTWNQFNKEVNEAALAFEILGIQENDNIAIYSQNRPEMLVTDFGAFNNRVVPVPLFATASKSQVEYIVKDASIKMIFVGDKDQYNIAREAEKDCEVLKQIIVYDKNVKFDDNDDNSLYFDQILQLGSKASDRTKAEVERRSQAATADDLACLIYTSGTTGEPKGVMLTHSNFDSQMDSHVKRLETVTDEDVSMNFLPLSHIFERAWAYFCLTKGIKMAINIDPREIQKTICEINPTIMCSVPRFWEKVYTAVQEKVHSMSGFQKKMVDHALKIGKIRNLDYERVGKKAPWHIEMQYKLFDKLVFSKLRRAIGIENGNIFPTAGAPLSDNIVEFLHSAGINIVVGYGLSESTATVSCYPILNYKIGTIGTKLPALDVKIGPNNEILLKGPTIMKGYYNKPAETAKAFTPDGYFRTGDAGTFDEDGNLIMTERIKDLFKTSNGKYIAPQALESRLGEDKYIEQVAVIGDQRKYVTAIIIPAYEALKEYAHNKKIKYQNVDELVKNSEIYKMIEDRINNLQQNFAGFEQIKKFTLLPRAFSMETGELTNTLKIRRPVINQLYRNEIDAMYA